MFVVCCEPGVKAALTKGTSADVRLMDPKDLPPAKTGDVQVIVTPVSWELRVIKSVSWSGNRGGRFSYRFQTTWSNLFAAKYAMLGH